MPLSMQSSNFVYDYQCLFSSPIIRKPVESDCPSCAWPRGCPHGLFDGLPNESLRAWADGPSAYVNQPSHVIWIGILLQTSVKKKSWEINHLFCEFTPPVNLSKHKHSRKWFPTLPRAFCSGRPSLWLSLKPGAIWSEVLRSTRWPLPSASSASASSWSAACSQLVGSSITWTTTRERVKIK